MVVDLLILYYYVYRSDIDLCCFQTQYGLRVCDQSNREMSELKPKDGMVLVGRQMVH